MLELSFDQPIFVGFKAAHDLKRQLESLSGPDAKYVSIEDSTFLQVCWVGEDLYVGKVIHERLTTERVDDVRRNVLSILGRLLPETRVPSNLEIFACRTESAEPSAPKSGLPTDSAP